MNRITLLLKGMAMGIAEVIPGVSGGTIAFISGIYEELIDTIKSVLGPDLFKGFKEGGIAGAWKAANGEFVLTLLAGMVIGIVSGVFTVVHLLETHPQLLWAFFFGLILASAVYMARQVQGWGLMEVIALVFGTALAYYITVASPSQGSESLVMVFVAGAIAISALILPGISGSFILLLMGMYTFILPTVREALKTFDASALIIVGVFALGCLFGLATFSRVLSWTFKHYRNITIALLTGFLIGSLNKLWPWRNVLEYRTDSKGETVPFLEKSVLPGQFEGDPQVAMALLLMVVGIVLILGLERLGAKSVDQKH
ncbi:MAG: DUF368 domain-containing protein [Saprospiraceae bacterium]|nr:DUF368 domain-containing protein [Saprospiraceae bacterium]